MIKVFVVVCYFLKDFMMWSVFYVICEGIGFIFNDIKLDIVDLYEEDF